MKQKLKDKAIKLRSEGLSYSEILKNIPVAKSTLSLWLRSVGLSKRQKQRLTEKRLAAIKRGWAKWSQIRIKRTEIISKQAINEAKNIKITKENLWLLGIMLYWAEGSKAKDYDPSREVIFSNSDPKMIQIFLKWLKEYVGINTQIIDLIIYIHKNHQYRVEEVRRYWADITGFFIDKFDKIYYKKHNISTKRKNIGEKYYGLLRIRVKKSTDLNRKIAGWIEGVCQNCGVV